MKSQRVLLIDADILLYRFAYQSSYTITWEEGVASEVTNLNEALFNVDSFVEQCMVKTKTQKCVMCLSVPTAEQFRYELYPDYKANRKLAKPVLHAPIKEHLMENYEYRIKEGLEADDVLGILMSREPSRYILMSGDKDLMQIHGLHFDPNGGGKVFKVTPREADRWFYIQTLIGDSTDNISGCPKIGKVKAPKIIDSVIEEGEPAIWQTIVETYEKAGKDEEYALLQARLVRILRWQDYDHKKKVVIPWQPMKT